MQHFSQYALCTHVWQQVQMEGRAAIANDLIAQQAGRRIHQAALHTTRGGDKFAFALERHTRRRGQRQRHRLERKTCKALGKMFAPAALDVKAAVGWQQRCHRNTTGGQQRNPGAIGTQPRPTATTQCQHNGARAHFYWPVWGIKT